MNKGVIGLIIAIIIIVVAVAGFVVYICTSSSSDLGQSGKLLQKEANSGNWIDGHRFSSNASDSDIQEWTDNLK